MRKLIIVQARMGSSRLPGKVLEEVCGKTLLEHLIVRLRRVKQADKIVIATTIKEEDIPIVDMCKKLDVLFYRGSEEDVLSRYYEAALQYKGDLIVRVTSDCPVIDPDVVGYLIDFYMKNLKKYDYVTNTLRRTYPRGMDVEIVSFKALKEAHFNAYDPFDREHVTPFIKSSPSRYSLKNIEYKTNLSHYRLTVDTSEDLELIKKIFKELYFRNPEFKMEDILTVLKANSEWLSINSHVIHKSQRFHQN
jgi:spore coat polysaccharide biosynthesis protein SpsF